MAVNLFMHTPSYQYVAENTALSDKVHASPHEDPCWCLISQQVSSPVQISSDTVWLQLYCLITVQYGFSVTTISTEVTGSCEKHLELYIHIFVMYLEIQF